MSLKKEVLDKLVAEELHLACNIRDAKEGMKRSTAWIKDSYKKLAEIKQRRIFVECNLPEDELGRWMP